MNLRPYLPEDLQDVLTVFRASVTGLGGARYSPAQLEAWAAIEEDSWKNRLATLNVFVAEANGTLLGFIAWTDEGYIDFLYVSPHAARQGVATTLCNHAEQSLLASGCTRLTTDASEIARPFFEQRGYSVLKSNDVERRGEILRNYSMERPLTPTG